MILGNCEDDFSEIYLRMRGDISRRICINANSYYELRCRISVLSIFYIFGKAVRLW